MNIRSKASTAHLAQPPQPVLHSISVSPSHPTCHQPPLPNGQQTTKKEASRSRNHDRKGFYLLWQERRVRMRYVRPNTNYSTPSCRDSYPRLHLPPPIDAHVGLAQHLHLLAYLLGLILRATSPPTTFPLSSTFCSPPQQTNPSYNTVQNIIADRPPPPEQPSKRPARAASNPPSTAPAPSRRRRTRSTAPAAPAGPVPPASAPATAPAPRTRSRPTRAPAVSVLLVRVSPSRVICWAAAD